MALLLAAGLGRAAMVPARAEVPLPERKPPGIPLPDRKPGAAIPTQTDQPERAEDATPTEPPHPSDVAAADWSEQEITDAKAACAKLFDATKVAHEPLAPLRKGRCGAPAPVKARTIGAAPGVEIVPAATLRCEMAAAVGRWLAEIVQPAAVEHLGEPVARLGNVASYVCRPRYNDRSKRISEHALANALDIASFETKSGRRVIVLDHWVSLAKPESEEPASKVENGAPEKANPTPKEPTAQKAEAAGPANEKESPSDQTAPSPAETPQSAFLRSVHEGACKIFGTVLGPEANAAHRDHLHLDLVKRRSSAYCR